jgi:8-oxo-dGTP diphosphatase
MKPIRNSAKAIIIRDNQILLTKNLDRDGYFYLFPGGGQEKGETLKDALERECVEEVGCRVNVNDLLFIREYIGKNHEHAEWDNDVHQVEFYFECLIEQLENMNNGTNPDDNQVGVVWINTNKLDEVRIYPRVLANQIKSGLLKPSYLGDTN